jgi:serpin B
VQGETAEMEMYMKPLVALLIASLVLPVAGWAAETAPSATADQAAVVEGNNAFAVELYNQLRNQSGNLFFSPESISTALAMAYAGARGDTASETAETLHFTLPPDRLHPAMGELLSNLNSAHDGYQLRVADALWAEKNYTFLDVFLKLTSSDYGGGFNQVDFKGAHEAARLTINQWVEQKTENKIRDLIPPGALDSTTRLVLTNAIYFKGEWQTQFDKASTRDEDFHLSGPEPLLGGLRWQTIKAPLMHRTGGFNYLNGGTFQALEIPYKTEELSMIVFLPNDAGGLPALERSLTAYNMRQWLGRLQHASKVILTLPKFKMTRQFELHDALAAMGMPQAFDRKMADFSGIASRKTMLADGNLYISSTIHKAYVDVDEEGTEAAAATGIQHRGLTGHPSPPIIFCADHPFVFLIRDNHSGSILFIGRVTNPSTQQQTSKNVQQPAEATPPPIPPPPPPLAPKEISLGQTEDVVVANLGQPERIAKIGAKEIYFYKDLKVTFVNGKVTDGAAAQVNTSPEQTEVNLLFVYKQGPLVPDNCGGQFGCGLDVYADDGTGYKKALGWEYAGSAIRVSRANGQVALFIPVEHYIAYGGALHLAKAADDNGTQREWVLEGDSFKEKRRPFPPDCCGRRAIESAAKTYPQRVTEFNVAQQKDLQDATIIVFSQDKGTADVIRSYPFLRGSLHGINAERIAESRGH